MRLLPPYLHSDVRSGGERRLFEVFKTLKLPDLTCLHSVNLPHHLYKAAGELDFVIVGPEGLLVLEVKSGGISRKDGIWYYEDRYGIKHHSSEGPFNQASSGLYSLRERLLEHFTRDEMNSLVMGYAVVFPDSVFLEESVEWDQTLVLDAHRWEHPGVAAFLSSAYAYWHRKFPDRPAQISKDLISRLVSFLRPDFEVARSIRVEVADVEARLISLTGEQYSRLDIIEHCSRILIEGSAGTGKTFLALETARRHAADGKKVLFVCFSPVLAASLLTQNLDEKFEIVSVHTLMLSVARKYGRLPAGFYPGMPLTSPWFVDHLAPAFESASRDLPPGNCYDVLIIDEGQDILNLSYLTGLENLLIGGLKEGIWRIFFDPFNQGAIFGAVDPEVLELLRTFGPVPPKLTVNCRNTDPIVLQTKLTTGADMAVRSTGPGPDVTVRFYYDRDSAAVILDEFLSYLDSEECPPEHITILSPVNFDQSCASRLGKKWQRRLKVLSGSIEERFPVPSITFSTVANFKGLENRFIALVDIEALDTTSADLATLYVGMTRARGKLWMALNENLRPRINEISTRNLKKFIEPG